MDDKGKNKKVFNEGRTGRKSGGGSFPVSADAAYC